MIKYENGIHDISNNEYHSSAGISRSMLMDFKRSPYHYWHKHLSGYHQREESTPEMNLGSAVHTLVLEPEKFSQEFFVISQKTRPSKGTPPALKNIEAAAGRIILTPSEESHAKIMAARLQSETHAQSLLKDCRVEQSIYFTHKPTGLQVKSRPDAWLNGLAIDLKTSGDASYRAFQSSAMTYGYFLQTAFMAHALESVGETMESFVNLVVEKKSPYPIAVYMISDDALAYGLKQFDDLMMGLAHCLENDKWNGYGIRILEVPGYAKYDNELEID